MRQQATIKVAPKNPTPAGQPDAAKTLSVAAVQGRAAMKNWQIYVKREFSKLVNTLITVTVGLEKHIFTQVQLAFNF